MEVNSEMTTHAVNTPGIDGVVWKTDKSKENAILNLETKGFRASPLRRIYIEKFGKKEKRPLGIPTMSDRAMQAEGFSGFGMVITNSAKMTWVTVNYTHAGINKDAFSRFLEVAELM